MLEIAKQKNLYTKLECDDIVHFLQNNHDKFDLIVATDVFCYFGDLSEILKLCSPNKIIFSIEISLETENYKVQVNGRFQHNPEYIKQLLQNLGYTTIKVKNTTLRQELGSDINGNIYIAEK